MAAAESSFVVSEEALTYMLCLSSENRAYSEERTEAGYIFFVLWERCFCMAANGIREESIFFPNTATGGTLGWDKNKKTSGSGTPY